jgi:hypothetical protein
MRMLDDRPTTEVVTSYRSTISEKHQRDVEADARLREAILSKIEATRQCGTVIAAAHADLRNRDFAEATNFLSTESVKAYLKFAKSNPAPISDLENALRAVHAAMQTSGALESPDGHGAQVSHDPPPFPAWSARMVMQFKVGFQKYLAARPLKNWRADEAEQFAFSLRPILKIHKMITESFHEPQHKP